MASITKKKNSKGEDRWQVQVRMRGASPVTSTHARLSDARRWAAEQETAIRQRRLFGRAGPTTHTVSEAIDRYFAERLDDLAEGDRKSRRYVLEWWRERIGPVRLAELSPDDFGAGLAALAKRGLSPGRQNRYMAAISKVLTLSVREWRWCERNPAREVTRRREPPGRVRVLTEAELGRLRVACAASRCAILAPLVEVALATAARQGELLSLEWEDVDLERGVATFRQTKNRTDRSVPLGETAKAALAGLGERDSGSVFGMKSFPKEAWGSALVAANVKGFRFHDLRHTAASMLAMSGATARELAEILGHKGMAMVMRYSHFYDSHLYGIVDKMNARFLTRTDPSASRAKR